MAVKVTVSFVGDGNGSIVKEYPEADGFSASIEADLFVMKGDAQVAFHPRHTWQAVEKV